MFGCRINPQILPLSQWSLSFLRSVILRHFRWPLFLMERPFGVYNCGNVFLPENMSIKTRASGNVFMPCSHKRYKCKWCSHVSHQERYCTQFYFFSKMAVTLRYFAFVFIAVRMFTHGVRDLRSGCASSHLFFLVFSLAYISVWIACVRFHLQGPNTTRGFSYIVIITCILHFFRTNFTDSI